MSGVFTYPLYVLSSPITKVSLNFVRLAVIYLVDVSVVYLTKLELLSERKSTFTTERLDLPAGASGILSTPMKYDLWYRNIDDVVIQKN